MSASCTASRWNIHGGTSSCARGAPRADDGLLVGHQFRLHEQVAEGRMQFVGNRRRQHHFGIGGDLDRARRGDRDW